jgi:hypothetical protein
MYNKQSKSEVLPNQFIKPHTKDGMVKYNE